ncbi:MAG: alkaline phosphatase family protein, partial [Gemmatimonadota bacterium]|nr:alkaline phosphatase family protein [Gemmatimonadota bacterium]
MKALPVTGQTRTLLLVVADGVRHDVLKEEIDAGKLPAVAALVARGGLYEVSSCFPSVTGAAYVPFYVGRFPAAVGVPGLRWFDRSRRIGFWPSHARSYAGVDIWHLDKDLDRNAHTLFELARPSMAAMSMLGRGARTNIGLSLKWMLRVAPAHFRGNLNAWRKHEENITRQFFRRFEKNRPRFASIALTSPDKLAHKIGPRSPAVRASIRDIDNVVSSAVAIATRGGWRDLLDIWVVGDHGHDPVENHEDLHGWLEARGLKVRAHPQVFKRHADVALMVGGNAMAHLYLIPKQRFRSYWPELGPKWQSLHDALLQRDAIDLLAVALDSHRVL